jgi:hypothetical protein
MDETEKLSQMMIRCGLATGHGDTIDDLIFELEKQIRNTLLANAFSDARKQIEQLRKALRFYAEREIYAPAVDAIIEEDRGDKAREALKEKE